jgi:hypothetical protein
MDDGHGRGPDKDDGFRHKPKVKEKFAEPVSWLVGRDLIAGLKWIALYTAFKGKIDPRDWMRGNVFPRFGDDDRATDFWRQQKERQWRWKVDNVCFWEKHRQRQANENPGAPDFWRRGEGTADEEFWFDYIADSGDGQMAVYNVAYLCLSDLWTKPDAPVGAPVCFEETERFKEELGGDAMLLPRGQFLFVGGDTSYHIADYASLVARFQLPFRWAFAGVRRRLAERDHLTPTPDEQGRIPVKDGERIIASDSEPRRPIFGIPGNHDYYDLLHGFNRQFRAPAVTVENRHRLPPHMRGLRPQLTLPGFVRRQQASYVAVHLPFRWWFWGLDTEVSKLDVRQQTFFAGLRRGKLPDKLIVATPEPTTVFRKRKADDDRNVEAYVVQLRLKQPFLAAKGEPPGKCRLDLSGDVHHYARYYGPDTSGLGGELSSDRYASVVAGGGGAFHHPTETHIEGPKAITEQVLYPDPVTSHQLVAKRLFDLRNIRAGGYVWLFGMVIAAALYFAVTVPSTSRRFFEWIMSRVDGALPRLPRLGQLSLSFTPEQGDFVNSVCQSVPTGAAPVRFVAPAFLLLAALGFVVFAIARFVRILKRVNEALVLMDETPLPDESIASVQTGDEGDAAAVEEPPITYGGLLDIGLCLASALALYVAGVWRYVGRAHDIDPFDSSLLVLYHVLLALGLVVLSVQNSGWLAQLAKFSGSAAESKARYVPATLLGAAAAATAFFGVWMFGRYSAACTLSDSLAALVFLGLLAALIGAGAFVAGELQGGGGKLLLGLVGLWHGLLQLVAPLWLVRLGDWRALVLALFLIVVFSGLSVPFTRIRVDGLGARAMRKLGGGRGGPLLVLWVTYGLIMLGLPLAFHERTVTAGGYSTFLPAPDASAWLVFFAGLAAALGLGFLLSMSWLSWYFAVSLGFQGHNNEVGGAARIEQFKHIVRLRVRRDDLTAYVIAFDEPQVDGATLKPRLIDVFTLTTKAGRHIR